MRRWNSPDYETKPYRVTWLKADGNAVRTYASEADARSALASPFAPGVKRAVLDRMEEVTKMYSHGTRWRAVRMDGRERRKTDR